MVIGKYGKMILRNMATNYPYRKRELEMSGELENKIKEREKYILNLKEGIEEQIKTEYPQPKTNEISVVAKWQKLIEELVDEILMKDILVKI